MLGFRAHPVVDRDDLETTKCGNRDRFEHGAGIGAHRESAAVQVDQHAFAVKRLALRGDNARRHAADSKVGDIDRIDLAHFGNLGREHGFEAAADHIDRQVVGRRAAGHARAGGLHGPRFGTGEFGRRQFERRDVDRAVGGESRFCSLVLGVQRCCAGRHRQTDRHGQIARR